MTPFDELRRKYRAEADRYIAKFGLTGRHNGQADAFRHAYASAAMTQDYGEWVANIAGQSHEIKNQISAWWENEDKSREVKWIFITTSAADYWLMAQLIEMKLLSVL